MPRAHTDSGFSLIEMLVATAIVSASIGVFLHLAAAGQLIARAQPEAADLQQRLRVAADMIYRDLVIAGAGWNHGQGAGPLVNYLPPIVPARTGARNPDGEFAYTPDRLSVLYVTEGSASASPVTDMPAPASDVPIDGSVRGCPVAGLCGFLVGTRSLLVDLSGVGSGFELFSVTGITGGLEHGGINPGFSRAYTRDSRATPVTQHVYYLDRTNNRLMRYDGYQSDVPLVDNVVDLRFAYYVDPSPRSVARPPAGESSCVYAAGDPPVPLLDDLGGTTLQLANSTRFTDGPFCGLAPLRFDGDLLRIRRVRVTIRAQVAAADLRGSDAAFSSPGVSRSGSSYVPDLEVSFEVAPRNLSPTR